MDFNENGFFVKFKFNLAIVKTIRLHSFILSMRIWLQKIMIYLTKACWFLSEFVMGRIKPLISILNVVVFIVSAIILNKLVFIVNKGSNEFLIEYYVNP